MATGETWFGDEALELKLCDRIATVDEVLLQLFKEKHTLYLIKRAPPEIPHWLQFLDDDDIDDTSSSHMKFPSTLSHLWNDLPNIFFDKFWCWFQKRAVKEFVNGNNSSIDIPDNITNLNSQQLSFLFNTTTNMNTNKASSHGNLSITNIEEAVTDVPPPSMTQFLAIDTTHKYKSK